MDTPARFRPRRRSVREEGENGAGISSESRFGDGERGKTKAGFRLSGGDIPGVSSLNLGVDWLLGGFTVEESINRGRLRNGVFMLLGVDAGGANGRALGAGVLWVPISHVVLLCLLLSGKSMGSAGGFAVPGGDDNIGSTCARLLRLKGVAPSTRRRLFPSLTGSNSASNSASRMPGVSGSSGGVLSIASYAGSPAAMGPIGISSISAGSSESSITSRCWRVALWVAGWLRATLRVEDGPSSSITSISSSSFCVALRDRRNRGVGAN